MQLKSPIALVKDSYVLYRKHIQLLICIVLVPTIIDIAFALALSVGMNANTSSLELSPINLTASIASFLISMLATIALILAINNTEKEHSAKIAYEAARPHFFKYLLLVILSGAIVAIGFRFFIIPGIFLGVWFIFSYFTLLLEGKTVIEAMKSSKEYVRGLWLHVFLRLLVLILIAGLFILAAAMVTNNVLYSELILTTVSMLLTPFVFIYLYLLYRDVRHVKSVAGTH